MVAEAGGVAFVEESKFGGCACVIYTVIIKVQYRFKHQLILAAF